MKSLSILILLGTATAIVLGGIFAVRPVLARNQSELNAALVAIVSTESEPVAPVTGSIAEVEQQAPAADLSIDPGQALASTFTVNISKDTSTLQSAQEAETQTQADAVVTAPTVADLDSFVTSVTNGDANQVTGVYVDGVLAYSVVRQPSGDASFVSETDNMVTQFGLAAQYGSQAFLAHNYLAGSAFFSLSSGQIVTLVYGDGSTQDFRIENIYRFQALSPDSTQSSFVNLETGDQFSASTLFHTIYNSDNSVVLQTCIAQDGISTWGRLFITAVPIS